MIWNYSERKDREEEKGEGKVPGIGVSEEAETPRTYTQQTEVDRLKNKSAVNLGI